MKRCPPCKTIRCVYTCSGAAQRHVEPVSVGSLHSRIRRGLPQRCRQNKSARQTPRDTIRVNMRPCLTHSDAGPGISAAMTWGLDWLNRRRPGKSMIWRNRLSATRARKAGICGSHAADFASGRGTSVELSKQRGRYCTFANQTVQISTAVNSFEGLLKPCSCSPGGQMAGHSPNGAEPPCVGNEIRPATAPTNSVSAFVLP